MYYQLGGMRMVRIYTLMHGWEIASTKKGWFLFYEGTKAKDPLGQTGLGGPFKTPLHAARALGACTFDPMDKDAA